MESTKAKVIIILVNYNGHRDTIECLESVLKTRGIDFQILVVDNSETDESLAQLTLWAEGHTPQILTAHANFVLPLVTKPIQWKRINEDLFLNQKHNEQLIFIKAQKNKGFSAANNIGLKYASIYDDFDFCWLLNNDTVVAPDALYCLISAARINNWGIAGSVLYDYGTDKRIQAMGGRINKFLGTTPVIKDKHDLDKIDLVVGASFIISKECLKQVGLLSEEYFLYYEETDYCYTATKLGYLIGTAVDSLVYHKGGASTGASSKKVGNISMKIDLIQLESRSKFHKKHLNNKLGLYTTIIISILNRIRRKQFKRIPKIIKLLYT